MTKIKHEVDLKVNSNLDKVNKDFGTLQDTLTDIAGIDLPDFSKFKNFGSVGMIGGAIGGAAVAAGAYAYGINNADKANRMFLETTGELNKEVIASTNALAGYSGEAQKDILKASNAFANTFGVNSTKTIGFIEEAFKKGANANGEFLDSLAEYSPQLKQIGLDAEQSIAFLTEAGRSGVFSDKAVDSVKEAGLRLREMTKATSDSLKPLRDAVEQQIRQKAAVGKTWEAMKLLSKELREGYLTEQQKATIMADSFGSAGEDAGMKWISNLDQIKTSLEGFEDRITPLSESSLELNKEWEKFKTSVFESDGFMGTLLTKVKTVAKDVLKTVNESQDWKDVNEQALKEVNKSIREDKKREKDALFNSEAERDKREFFSKIKNEENALIEDKANFFKKIKNLDEVLDPDKGKGKGKGKGIGSGILLKTTSDERTNKNNPLAAESSMSGSGIKNLTINVEKMVESIYITPAEDPMKIKDKVQMALTQIVLDSKLA